MAHSYISAVTPNAVKILKQSQPYKIRVDDTNLSFSREQIRVPLGYDNVLKLM